MTGCNFGKALFKRNALPSIPTALIAAVDDVNTCEGSSFKLNKPTVMGASYSWTGSNGFTSSEQNPTITNATTTMSGVYNVVIVSVFDCPSLPVAVCVIVAPIPSPVLDDGFVSVDGVSQMVISNYTLNAGLSTINYDVEWYEIPSGVLYIIPSQITNTYVVNAPGTYGVKAKNKMTNCISEIVIATVILSSRPTSVDIITTDYLA